MDISGVYMEKKKMKKLWNIIEETNMKRESKNNLFLAIQIIKFAAFGALAWVILGMRFFPGIESFLCFLGYPAVFGGFLGGALYLYNHEFAE